VHPLVKLRLGDAMPHSAHTVHAADRRPAASAAVTDLDQVGVYLTNEVFLYRVADHLVNPAGETVDVEDCYRLDVVRVPARGLAARRLRIVTPS
jgi:hypothetical protein